MGVVASAVSASTKTEIPTQSNFLQRATYFTERNISVIPVIGKKPFLEGWPSLATTDPIVLNQWNSSYPNANVGVPTGTKAGFFVLDIDPENGGWDSLDYLTTEHGSLPETWTTKTGRNGRHYWYKYPVGRNLKTGANLLPGVDIRSDGGQAVGAGSIHENGRLYEWLYLQSPDDVELAEAPEWLLDLICVQARRRMPIDPEKARLNHEAAVNFANAWDRKSPITDGHRNATVLSVAASHWAHGLQLTDLDDLLQSLNSYCEPHLSKGELGKIYMAVVKLRRYKHADFNSDPDGVAKKYHLRAFFKSHVKRGGYTPANVLVHLIWAYCLANGFPSPNRVQVGYLLKSWGFQCKPKTIHRKTVQCWIGFKLNNTIRRGLTNLCGQHPSRVKFSKLGNEKTLLIGKLASLFTIRELAVQPVKRVLFSPRPPKSVIISLISFVIGYYSYVFTGVSGTSPPHVRGSPRVYTRDNEHHWLSRSLG